MHAWITTDPIDVQDVIGHVGSPDDGAVVLFLGTVRRENEGRAVRGMRYDTYVEMAESTIRAIAGETARRAGTDRIALVHRTGELAVGEVSVAIAVSTPHRPAAFDAARYAIEEIKRRLPVWKHEHYVTGESAWLAGVVPPVSP